MAFPLMVLLGSHSTRTEFVNDPALADRHEKSLDAHELYTGNRTKRNYMHAGIVVSPARSGCTNCGLLFFMPDQR